MAFQGKQGKRENKGKGKNKEARKQAIQRK